MKRQNQLLLLTVVLLAGAAAAFLLLAFRLQRAQMAVDSEVAAYGFGRAEEASPTAAQVAPAAARDLDLYVEVPAALKDEMVEALRAALDANGYVEEVMVREGVPAPADESVLVVAIEEPSVLFWSPFYVRTVMSVSAAYASDGEVDWIEDDVVVLTSEDGDEDSRVVRMRGEYGFDGRAYGLISGPGYAQYLAEEVAHHVNQSLSAHVASQASVH